MEKEITIILSDGDQIRLERIKELRNWSPMLSDSEMISRCIGFAWLAAENKNGVNQ